MTPHTDESRWRSLHALLRAFTPFQRMLLYGFTLLLALSAFVLLAQANGLVSVEIPARGGSFVEGTVGTPRFVNPLLAVAQPDQDLAMLVYSGLLRQNADGTFIPDLAESYEISDDGVTYTFHLRRGLSFHDGAPLTSEDVAYTVALAQNPEIKSPRRADWEGVTVAAPDPATVVFTLPAPYAPFLENASMGILPKHLWESVPTEEFPFSPLNTHPVGSGPYRVKDVLTDPSGAPTEYRLASFSDFALGEPNITRITYRVYPNEEALQTAFAGGDVDSFISTDPASLGEISGGASERSIPLSRVFGVFFNQNHAPVLADTAVRRALDAAVDKEAIVQSVLGGYGTALDGPVPPGFLPAEARPAEDATTTGTTTAAAPAADHAQEARDILDADGWDFDDETQAWTKDDATLSLKIATADTEDLVETANAVAAAWRAAGIQTDVEIYPLPEFNQNVLRPRAYDAALFGEVVGHSLDLFAFWHSSQRNDPGLNLSLYANSAADKALTDARSQTDPAVRTASLGSFLSAVAEDLPALFLYAPDVAYVVPSELHGIETGTVTNPAERFLHVYAWYRDTERVWDVFAPAHN